MPSGTVKFFNAAKGFGFITPDEKGKEVFLPGTSVTSAGISGLKAGQRLSFEALPDAKGPKAVDLKVIADVRPPEPRKNIAAPHPKEQEKAKLTIYLDSHDDAGSEALAEIRDAGFEPQVVDYIATPPSKDELKRLSLLLRDNNQSLARKYEPLFLELRLDDRFISDNEFWEAIFEHPSLINGPILATAARAAICRSEAAVESFLAALSSGESQAVPKPKGLPERLLRLVKGDAAPPADAQEEAVEKTVKPAAETGQGKTKAAPVTAPKAKPAPKTKAKAKAAVTPKAQSKAVAKTKAPAKKIDLKPVKRPVRAAKK